MAYNLLNLLKKALIYTTRTSRNFRRNKRKEIHTQTSHGKNLGRQRQNLEAAREKMTCHIKTTALTELKRKQTIQQ